MRHPRAWNWPYLVATMGVLCLLWPLTALLLSFQVSPWTDWTLLVTAMPLECHGAHCQSMTAAVPLVDFPVMTFPTHTACEAHRQQVARVPFPLCADPMRPGLTLTKHLTYRCQVGGPSV